MAYLRRRDGSAHPSEMAADLELSSARVAVLIAQLEKKGWISRKSLEADKRKIMVELTDKGLEHCKEKEKNIRRNAERLTDMLGAADTEDLIRILGRINDYLRETGEREC